MRIASICPSNTELLAYLGLTDQIVGVDNYSDWPHQINSLPRLGPDLDIDMEALQALEPDIVIASLSVPGMEKNVEQLQNRNIPHIVLNPNSLEEIGTNLLTLGEVTGHEQKAKAVHQRYFEMINEYKTLSERIKIPKRIYWEWWAKPVFTPGGVNWLTEVSRLAGGVNVFEDVDQASVQTDWETVKERNPDMIALVWVGVQKERVNTSVVLKRPGWNEMKAIQKNEMYVLDEPLFCRPSPRLLTGMVKLGALLHPEVFPAYEESKDVLLSAFD